LHFRYGAKEEFALKDVSLAIHRSERLALVGPNGSGKSTLLRLLARILRPASGSVLLNGQPLHDLPSRTIASQLSFLPQMTAVPAGLTVRELVLLGRTPRLQWWKPAKNEDHRIVEAALETADLLPLSERTVDTLSGGQRQRAFIAMALAQDAEVMLLDEPTTFLDLRHQKETLDLLMRLQQERGKTIVMVLHDLYLACRFADRLVMMREGQILREGTPEELMRPSVLEEVYGLRTRILHDPVLGTPLCVPE
jgi:iron complex transport system ATP-binding protein